MPNSPPPNFFDKLLHNRFMIRLAEWEPTGWKEAMIIIALLTAYLSGWLDTLWPF
jgi:hypothetical protein